MFARLSRIGPDLSALERVEAVVRSRFGLGEVDLVIVSEEAGRQPSEPERVTTILFWKGQERHRVRVFKPVAMVAEDDLPAAWVLGALKDEGEAECC